MRIQSACVAFCLTAAAGSSLPVHSSEIQFSQRPDMSAGTDIQSMHRSFGPVVVDDFVVNRPEIVGFRWWGSYFASAGQSLTLPRSVTFELSYHPDCPAGAPISARCPGDPRAAGAAPVQYGYSTPGQPYSFQIVSALETYFGTTAGGEDVYEYTFMLPSSWAATPGAISWLDIAWAAGQFGTDPLGSIWGWHESASHNLDFAVQTDEAANRQLPLGGNPHLGPWNLLQGRDMAFEVITIPAPAPVALVCLGLLGIGVLRLRARRAPVAARIP